ncbi:hypothetical protein OIO90_005783 [Microbotryomycetes sp. JL221]|nr:hypothetical protein OIO90_005783 [Microbotryomycetes sp. JL221]
MPALLINEPQPGASVKLSTRPLPFGSNSSPLLKHDNFGVIVEGINDINNLTVAELSKIQDLLYKHNVVLFEDVELTPQGMYELTLSFDPACAGEYGHGKKGRPDAKSVLHPDLRTLPHTPAVQLIGNGLVSDEEITQGLPTPVKLRHPSFETFHKKTTTEEGCTRFYRWHIDAALYEREPPKVTTLCSKITPQGVRQTLKYDDCTGDELEVPLGSTAFVSTRVMFDLLDSELKSLAVRSKVRYAPHPYVWMSSAKARPTGLGMESDGTEVARTDLPQWKQEFVKTYPVLWRNPVTNGLHFQVHPSGVESLIVDPVPQGVERRPGMLYPDGAHLTDLKQVRELLYSMQRPGIDPALVYAHDWKPNQLVLFNNRGTLHSVTGSFQPETVRAFWQCNLAASEPPAGPSETDLAQYA